MSERAFTEKSEQPTDQTLSEVLADSFGFYKSLQETTTQFNEKWSFYKGWSKKVFDKKKALFYLLPHHGSFVVGMAIRESERDAFMKDKTLAAYHDKLETAKKYPEGFAVQFDVRSKKSYKECQQFVNALIKVRTA